MQFSFEPLRRPAQQHKMRELETRVLQQQTIIQMLADALKQRGVLVTMTNGTVTLSEPEQPTLARVPGVPPRASAKKQPVVKKETTHHDKG